MALRDRMRGDYHTIPDSPRDGGEKTQISECLLLQANPGLNPQTGEEAGSCVWTLGCLRDILVSPWRAAASEAGSLFRKAETVLQTPGLVQDQRWGEPRARCPSGHVSSSTGPVMTRMSPSLPSGGCKEEKSETVVFRKSLENTLGLTEGIWGTPQSKRNAETQRGLVSWWPRVDGKTGHLRWF